MASHAQDVLALLLVALAAAHLVWRARCFYLSGKTTSGTRCGGCSSCARSARGLLAAASAKRNDATRTGVTEE